MCHEVLELYGRYSFPDCEVVSCVVDLPSTSYRLIINDCFDAETRSWRGTCHVMIRNWSAVDILTEDSSGEPATPSLEDFAGFSNVPCGSVSDHELRIEGFDASGVRWSKVTFFGASVEIEFSENI